MASRVEPHTFITNRISSPDDLRHAFEAAVCEIHHAEARTAADKKLQYRSPIVPRAKVLGISQANAEKRALSDAARALAQLWKV